MYHESLGNPHRFKWLECISNALQNSGFNFLWNRQGNITALDKKLFNKRLEDISLQNVISTCRQSNKGRNYLTLKEDWKLEPYL